MGFFTGVMHIPALFAFLALAAEFFGGLGLIFGFLTRIAAFGIFSNMIVAVAMVHHSQLRLLYELDGSTEGRGLRISPASACDHGFPDDPGCRSSFA
jgi:putative oxidoreductase